MLQLLVRKSLKLVLVKIDFIHNSNNLFESEGVNFYNKNKVFIIKCNLFKIIN
jgi:uncharacterized membrane protein